MISAILNRRVWTIKNRLFTTLGLLFILPIFLNIIINLPLKRLIVNPLVSAPFEQWIYPGLVIIALIITAIPTIYRDLFYLRIQNKMYPSLALTPVSLPIYFYNFYLSVVFESTIYMLFMMIILSIILSPGFTFLGYVILALFILLFLAFIINIIITLSLIINRTTLYFTCILGLLLFIVFASGLIIEFEYFPEPIDDILRYLPSGQIVQSLRMAVFNGVVSWINLSIFISITMLWTYLNCLLFQKRI